MHCILWSTPFEETLKKTLYDIHIEETTNQILYNTNSTITVDKWIVVRLENS